MLNLLYQTLLPTLWGPLRLLNSYFFLATTGFVFTALATWFTLPVLWGYLPKDRGRAHAVDAKASLGKPVGAGVILIGIIVLSIVIFVPFKIKVYGILPLLGVAAIVGFIDDRIGGLSELTLGLSDLALAIFVALILFGLEPTTMWLPFTTKIFVVPAWVNLPIVVMVVWLSINSVNCNDGVDGLSGTLSLISVSALGLIFYATLGNAVWSNYLMLPHNVDGPDWAIACAIACGGLSGYIWHNVPPSDVLMGDAGSRPIGLLLGVLVAASQNPFIILFCAITILANGATGLLKLALLRFFKVAILSRFRFPLHDHVRKNLNWSNAQVLTRFTLIHLIVTFLLLSILLKIR